MSGTGSWHTKAVLILGMIGVVTAPVFSKGNAGSILLRGQHSGGPRLISVEPLPDTEGLTCVWAPASANFHLAAAFEQGQGSAASASAVSGEAARLVASQRRPVRVIRDPNPGFSSVAIDPIRNEVVFTDENLHGVLVYDRVANTPPTATFTEPKRTIGGAKTKI